MTASAWTLGVTARIIHPGETPENILESLVKLGLPAVRTATRQAMRLLAPISCSGRPSRRRCGGRAGSAICAIRSTCWARARARGRTPSAILRLCGCDRGDRRQRRTARCPIAPASRSLLGAAPALRGGLAPPRAGRAGAGPDRTRPQGAPARSQFHRRRRGGGPAGAHPRGDGGGARRSVVARLGGLRARRRPTRSARRR